jgi:hypothetical protein
MTNKILWGLVGLNVLLLALFLSNYVRDNAALAQAQPGMPAAVAGRPGEYLLVPGAVSGLGSEVVYVIDTLNGQMGAVSFDVNGNRLSTMPATDLNRTFQAGVGPQGPVNPGVPGTVAPGATYRR